MSSEERLLKEWISSLTIKQMEGLQKILDPQQYMPILMLKQESMNSPPHELPPWAKNR